MSVPPWKYGRAYLLWLTMLLAGMTGLRGPCPAHADGMEPPGCVGDVFVYHGTHLSYRGEGGQPSAQRLFVSMADITRTVTIDETRVPQVYLGWGAKHPRDRIALWYKPRFGLEPILPGNTPYLILDAEDAALLNLLLQAVTGPCEGLWNAPVLAMLTLRPSTLARRQVTSLKIGNVGFVLTERFHPGANDAGAGWYELVQRLPKVAPIEVPVGGGLR